MSDKPKVSIIVPIYNVEKYLEKCLNSLINQTLKEIEIILIDDGSPDNCPKICDEYAKNDNRIKVIHKQNEGVSVARNTGIEMARADWIAFVDADDWVDNNMLEEAYKRTEIDNVDMVLFNYYSNYEKSEMINPKIPKEDFVTENAEIIQQLKRSVLHIKFGTNGMQFASMAAPWNKLFKSDIIKDNKIKFPLEVKGIFDDGLFNLYYYDCVKKLAFFNKPLYHYRRLSTSLVNKFKANKLEINQLIFNKLEEYLEQHQEDKMLRSAYYARVITFLYIAINTYFFNKDNPKNLKEKIKELREISNQEPYKTAIDKVEIKHLTESQRMYYRCLKKNMFLGVFILFNVRKIAEACIGMTKQ